MLASCLAATLPTSSASANFADAQAHIDLDGSMIGYIDFAGDGDKIGAALNEIYQEILANTQDMPPIPVDFNELIKNLGFGSIKAFAMSSKDIEPGLHRNRSVVLMNDAPTGLFAVYNPKMLSFTAAEKAPSDARNALTLTLDLRPLRDTSSRILQQIMGPMGEAMLEQKLAETILETDISYGEAIELLSGQWDAFWHQSYREDFQQDVKFWVSIEGAGSLLPRLREMAEAMGGAFSEDDTRLKANFGQLFGPDASIGLYVEAPKETGELIFYSHSDWTPDSEGPRLVDQPTFKNLASRLPSEGIAFYYDGGTDLNPLLAAMDGFPEAAKYKDATESILTLLIGNFLKPKMQVSYMDGDHWVSDQYAGYSTKQVITALPTIFVGGMGAAMAIPAFQKVRENSQQKAVQNNLRQIASAAQQYFLENGVSEVHIDALVGEGKYIRHLSPVAGESYQGMILRQGEAISVRLGNGSVITQEF
ncbi:MAG: hypothetical protein EA353_04595 [Puniceicoccaceae bacterium]|nr:MAG: hypothetical protein EA353_04595 [Puniceicoccaceae bacterium]